MKIRPEHLKELTTRCNILLEESGFKSWQEWLDLCIPPLRTRDKQMWFRWSIYSRCMNGSSGLQKDLYTYLNDANIYTALKYVITFGDKS